MFRRHILLPSLGLSLAINLLIGASYEEDGRGTQGKGFGSSQWEKADSNRPV
jgi:hypothetical protein